MRNRKPLQLNEMSQSSATAEKLRDALKSPNAKGNEAVTKPDWTRVFIASGGKAPGSKLP